MSPTSLNTLGKRRDTLELTGGQQVADIDQLRQQCPELFEAAFYLDRLSKALEGMKFSRKGALKSHLDEDGQRKLDSCVSHLTDTIQETLSQLSFEFTVQQASDNEEGELPVTRERDFTVVVSNAEALLKSAKQPLENLKVLHDVSDLIDTLEKRIEDLKESLANPSSREKNSIERSEIEIRVLEDELNDFNEFEKTGKPTAYQRNQKKQLEDNLEKHRGIIRKIEAKTRRKKERIIFTQETLDQVIQIFTEFLAQYSPEASADFSAQLNLKKVLTGNQAHTDHVSEELTRVLQTERTGDYTAYYPEVESRQKWNERVLMLRRYRKKTVSVLRTAIFALGAIAALDAYHYVKYNHHLHLPVFSAITHGHDSEPQDSLSYDQLRQKRRAEEGKRVQDMKKEAGERKMRQVRSEFSGHSLIQKFASDEEKEAIGKIENSKDAFRFTDSFVKNHLEALKAYVADFLKKNPPAEVRGIYESLPILRENMDQYGIPYDESVLFAQVSPGFVDAFKARFPDAELSMFIDLNGDKSRIIPFGEQELPTLRSEDFCARTKLLVEVKLKFPEGPYVPITNVIDLNFMNPILAKDKCGLDLPDAITVEQFTAKSDVVFSADDTEQNPRRKDRLTNPAFDAKLDEIVSKEPPVCFKDFDTQSDLAKRLKYEGKSSLRDKFIFIMARKEFADLCKKEMPNTRISISLITGKSKHPLGFDDQQTQSMTTHLENTVGATVLLEAEVPAESGLVGHYQKPIPLSRFNYNSRPDECHRSNENISSIRSLGCPGEGKSSCK